MAFVIDQLSSWRPDSVLFCGYGTKAWTQNCGCGLTVEAYRDPKHSGFSPKYSCSRLLELLSGPVHHAYALKLLLIVTLRSLAWTTSAK